MRKPALLILITALVLAMAPLAQADATLTFQPSAQVKNVGEVANVDVYINLNKPGAVLGDFNFGVKWNPGIASFDNLTFASTLGDPLLIETLNTATYSGGWLTVQNTSLLTAFDLAALQGDGTTDFLLFSFGLKGEAAGATPLSFVALSDIDPTQTDFIVLGDDVGNQYGLNAPQNGSITFNEAPIPEPATLLLVGTGVCSAFLRRRKK